MLEYDPTAVVLTSIPYTWELPSRRGEALRHRSRALGGGGPGGNLTCELGKLGHGGRWPRGGCPASVTCAWRRWSRWKRSNSGDREPHQLGGAVARTTWPCRRYPPTRDALLFTGQYKRRWPDVVQDQDIKTAARCSAVDGRLPTRGDIVWRHRTPVETDGDYSKEWSVTGTTKKLLVRVFRRELR
jgi:hypothetical protein